MNMIPPPLMGTTIDGTQSELLRALARSLNAEQAFWISGYFAGIAEARSGFAPLEASATAALGELVTRTGAEASATKIAILYGSETGNARALAHEITERARAQGLVVSLEDLACYKTRELKNEQTLVFVTSTYGEGEPPGPAVPFFEFLTGTKAPKLEHARFAVLALGDSTYEQYCEAGKLLDRRLAELGATRMHDRVDCDVDYEIDARRWIDGLLDKLKQEASQTQVAARASSLTLAASAPAVTAPVYGKNNPFVARVSTSQRLSGRGSSKDTHHLEISLEGSGLRYLPGDALGVVARNEPGLAGDLIALGGWSGADAIAGRNGATTLQQALQSEYEITALTPRFLEKWAQWSGAAELARLEGEQRARFLAQTHVVDLMQSHPVSGLAAQDFVQALRGLQPRLYSIASSLEFAPDEVHLCVAPVRYRLHERQRHGVASTHLVDRLAAGDSIPVYVQANEHFRLPADTATPIVMIGAGTGVAPYRAFMQQRDALGVTGKSWLFFGERNFRTDFLYQTEWQAWLRDGLLTRAEVAFSRDQQQKLYVQHRLLEHGRELYRWIADGAHLYVCGDAQSMAADVQDALLAILAKHGGLDTELAKETLLEMQTAGRYQKDVY